MKNQTILGFILFIGLCLFNLLFWQESLGVNLLLFSSFLISIAYFKEEQTRFRKEVYYAMGLTFITGFMVVWHNSGWSIFMHFVTSMITLGFIKQKELTTVFESIIGFGVSYVTSPLSWLRELKNRQKGNRAFALTYTFLRLCVIPLAVFVLFFLIYTQANPKFAELSSSFTQAFAELFKDFSFARFFFLLLGFTLISVAMVRAYVSFDPIAPHEDDLVRKKRTFFKKPFEIKINRFTDFMNEYKIGLLIFSVLNLLLLIVNIIDIEWIWFGFEVPEAFNLKSFVHEGTYLLIFSILLSMGIFLYFFRGNMNFYSKNKWLLILGKIWIVQNAILTVSVFIRNYHYIDYHGLAGKRIGVIAFLMMTVFGLISLIYKVNQKKTTAFLVRLNGWFIVVTMALTSVINWDRVILMHNLTHENTGEIDVDYYLKLDETLSPIIFNNIETIEAQMLAHRNRPNKPIYLRYLEIEPFKEQLEYRVSKYLEKREDDTWASWNRSDAKLKEKTKFIPTDELEASNHQASD